MNFIIRETHPMAIRINGIEYPAIWNFEAIAIMEDYAQLMHLYVVKQFREGHFEVKPMIGALVGMLKAAGVTCPDENGKDMLADALMQSIRPSEHEYIQTRILEIISAQGDQPAEGDPKNAPTCRRKKSKTTGTTI